MNRRQLLMALGGTALSACTTSTFDPKQPNALLKHPTPVAPVLVQRDRILKTIVGLRPYRSGGFRLEEEKFGEKLVIHNYGHAGDGVSLSWGCSQVAAEKARAAQPASIAILGAGVMGLTTGLLLAGWGFDVAIYTDKVSPNTTSDIAGALILVPDDIDPRIQQLSHNGWDAFIDRDGYGVKYVSHRFLGRRGTDTGPDGFLGRRVREANRTVLVDPSLYLPQIMNDFRVRGGKIFTKKFESLSDVLNLEQELIINCTGLGAGALFGDENVLPVRGQLTHLIPQPEVDYSYIASEPGLTSLYMFPRQTSIVLGGTRIRGETSLEPKPDIIKRVLEGHREMARWASGTNLASV